MNRPAMRIVIPGGSGQVGTLLARHFTEQGHNVTVLSRHPKPAPWSVLAWDAQTAGDWTAALEDCDILINLTGRSVNCRYNPENRRQIYDSRIQSTRVLNEVLSGLPRPPRLWLNASTATIYRHALDRPMSEATGELGGNEPSAPDTWNFSIRVAKDWEETFFAIEIPGCRKIALRSAVTFSADQDGVFDVLSALVRLGLGGANGNGNQMVSWIHGADFVSAIDFLIANESLSGIMNLASPNPMSNAAFMQALRQAWQIRIGLPAPAWLIELGCFFLQTESELVLKSRWVIPTRLEQAGFKFCYPLWPEAAQDLVKTFRSSESP